jgi:trans-aconitate methyltransferase
MLKEIVEQTEGDLTLTPQNAVVLTSTMPIASMFQTMGFAILPAEASVTPMPPTPHTLLGNIMAFGEGWHTQPDVRAHLSPTTLALWRDFPEVPRRIFRLWHDPLLTDDGSLTDTRNYATYAQEMSNRAIIDLKYQDIGPHILAGRIADEGCADGALLVRVARDFPDSDLIGIEITGELLARCHERQRAGEFGEAFIHFHQRNITTPIFQPLSIHTTICNSTLHELWSYNQGKATVMAYLREKYHQLAPQGRLLIRDVVGPEGVDDQVYLWLDESNGKSWGEGANTAGSLDIAKLSTYARFLRFARDFLPQRRAEMNCSRVSFTQEEFEGKRYIVTTLRWATEFITKMDYTDNWASEMHEEFAFWSFSDWQRALRTVGFEVNPVSHVYTNKWIVEHRWQGHVALFRREGDHLQPLPFPPTTIVLVAEKRTPHNPAAI